MNKKLKDEIFNMKHGDTFQCSDGDLIKLDEYDHLRFANSNILVVMNLENLKRVGKIIPVKKEPVGAEESVRKYMNVNGWENISTYKQAYIIGFKHSAENRDLLYADLMEYINEMLPSEKIGVWSNECRFKSEIDKINAVLHPTSTD